ncbi:MAG TPA: DJ-1/PfpI family protein [Acidobacteriota bacterium]|nr:DJ-1/PfpI family protein [Acidobacteriota bacterium]
MIRILALCIVLVWIVLPIAAQDHAGEGKEYVCPMFCKNAVYNKPGTCPVCGMTLVERASLSAQEHQNVAILVFDGVQIIDYTAPYEIFGQRHFNVYTVAAKEGPISTSMNMSVNPTYTFANAPAPYILIVPGGNVDDSVQDARTIAWIRKSAGQAEHVLSVCNGAFLLAKAGLLDGLSATTFHHLIDDLAQAAPKTKIVRDARYVDNGKIITSAGLSSGIDGSLYLISKIFGKETAQELALHLEYNWQPDLHWARAAMADRYISQVSLDLPDATDWKPVRNIGDMNSWELSGTVQSSLSLVKLAEEVRNRLNSTGWRQQAADGNQARWSFSGENGSTWSAQLTVEPREAQRYLLSLRIQRTSNQ